MKIPCYQVSAFATNPFSGNPAGVCPLTRWLDDATLRNIAANNNLSETAYIVPRGEDFELRWFTPTTEVDLCGHATLATAFVLFSELHREGNLVRFHSRSGVLTVKKENDLLVLDFPARLPVACSTPEPLLGGLGAKPVEVRKARDYLAVFATEAEVRALKPDFAALRTLDCLGIIATAPGIDCDFVSRFFAPAAGIDEDPATGSSHCTLIPYWAQRLGKSRLFARQVSARGGEMFCQLVGDRVHIGGQAALYSRGEIEMAERRPVSPSGAMVT